MGRPKTKEVTMTAISRITRRALGVALLVSGAMMLMTPVFAGDANANFSRLVANTVGVSDAIPLLVKKDGPVLEAPSKRKPHNSPRDPEEFTTDFRIEECTYSATGRNPYFSVNPGDVLVFAGGGTDLTITVLNETRDISFVTARGVQLTVTTRVVEERESQDGILVEVSRNFFARCQETNNINYFGEDVQIFENGVISTEGSWLAGTDGALPGLIMPGSFLLGSRYFQEQAPGVALDRSEHIAMGSTVTVPAGTFEDCVEVIETTPLERGASSTKIYCPGIGLVDDDGVELVSFAIAP
jgi:hypothetical protein